MNECEILTLFPSSIYRFNNLLSNDELMQYVDITREIKNKTKKGGENWQSSVYNTLGTYNLIYDKRFDSLINLVTQHVKTFNAIMGSDYNYECNYAWTNSYGKNDWQEWHNHAGSTYSAVFFLKSSEGASNIFFQDPAEPYDMLPIKNIKEYNSFNAHDGWIPSTENTLIIFRSYLKHMVPINGCDERITVAFNF